MATNRETRRPKHRFRAAASRHRIANMPNGKDDVQFERFQYATDDDEIAEAIEQSAEFKRGRVMREPDVPAQTAARRPKAPDTTRDGRGDEGNQKPDEPDTTRDGRGDEGANKPAKRTRTSTASKKTASKKAGRRRGTKKSP